MSLSQKLDLLADPAAFPGENATWVRWGQLLRTTPKIASDIEQLSRRGCIVRLAQKGTVRGGVVTRANAFFLVRELAFSDIPARMRVTKSDMRRIAVVLDGLGYAAKVERKFLKPVLKGPESLQSAVAVKETDMRLVDVKKSKEELASLGANGVLSYLKRGETSSYKVSGDDLKGGVPAERSQIKNRRPYWYSLSGEQEAKDRIVFPEHIDRRYVYTLVKSSDESVVIDKLFLFEPDDNGEISFLHAGLNSIFTWYQTELRGRSQLGEGVLELKIPDYQGIFVADPTSVAGNLQRDVLDRFAALKNPGSGPSLEELGTADRLAFDVAYLRACGFSDPEEAVLLLEQELRALAGERAERKLSVADAKLSRRKATNVAASIDAYAAKIAAGLVPYPDPRDFFDPGEEDEIVGVLGEPEYPLEVGTDLFNLGAVFAGGIKIAQASSIPAAQIVQAVLLIDPAVHSVRVPTGRVLSRLTREWQLSVKRWYREFETNESRALVGVNDPRIRAAVRASALRLMHAK